MHHKIIFTRRSLIDLAEIINNIAKDDPAAASRFGSALLDHIDLLSRFPKMGEPILKRKHVRKLLHSPVLVYYKTKIDIGLIEILHIRHGARKRPKPAALFS